MVKNSPLQGSLRRGAAARQFVQTGGGL